MTMGLVGRKCGMTRVFTEDGISVPVTVIEAQPNRITQVKTVETDGYRALQVAAGSRKASRVSKPAAGHFAAAKVEAGDLLTEFRLADSDETEYELGSTIEVGQFEVNHNGGSLLFGPDGKLYFSAFINSNGRELWVYDGVDAPSLAPSPHP